MRVLIAEDDPISRRLLEASLKRWGYDVEPCADGSTAWQILQKPGAPRLAILDWTMPGLEGTEICRRVRELPHGKLTYIIMVTAKGETEDVVAGLEAGADDYITKGFEGEELRARVQVGVRVVELQDRLMEAERNRVLMQAAGAAAHEINQPLTVLMGTAQILSEKLRADDPHGESIEAINRAAERIDAIVRKMGEIRQYATKPYLEGIDIIDFDAATGESSTEGGK
jgi:DNA-binding response OmpR family regulator